MPDVAPVAAPPVAPTNGAHPATPQKPAAPGKPVDAKPPEVDDGEEFTVNGEKLRLSKAEQRLRIQKDIAADKRLKEAADQRNKLADLEKLLEEDPEAYFAKKGKDVSKFFASHLEKQAKAALLTPEQREAERLQRELEGYKAKEAADKKKADEAKQSEADRVMADHIERGLIAAADKHGLDNDPETLESLQAIAYEFAIDYKIPVTFDQIAEEHIRRHQEHIQKRDTKLLSVLSGKKLLDHLGKENVAKVKAALAEADAASLNDIPKPQARPKVQVKAHERETKGYLRESDFDKKFLK